MRDLVIGRGEIGSAVIEVLDNAGHEVTSYDVRDKNELINMESLDVLHICIPYTESFVADVRKYIRLYTPKHTIIWSTVQIGTTKKIPMAVHAPVEGRHPHLSRSIGMMTRWFGYNSEEDRLFFDVYFSDLRLRPKAVPNSDCTEALKLLSTTEYGLNIIFADYKKQIADSIGMDFNLTKDWNQDYNYLYDRLEGRQFKKFILDPPEGKIGGHCIMPNVRLLNKQYPNDLLDLFKRYES